MGNIFFSSIEHQYEWNSGDALDDFHIDSCIAQIKSLAMRFTLGMVLGIFGLTAYLFVTTSVLGRRNYSLNIVWNGFISLVIVGGLLAIPAYLAMRRRSKQIRSRNFSWRTGTVVKKYRGRRGKARVCVDDRFNECYPFALLKTFNEGDTVLVIRFSKRFGQYVFSLPD